MWVEYHKSVGDNCLVCGQEIDQDELCIGLQALPRGLIEQVFPFHPDKTNSRIINLGSIRLGKHVDWNSLDPIKNDDLENSELPPIGKNYIHLLKNCFSPAIHRPFQCMFEYKSIESEDVAMVERMIVDWQKLRKILSSPQKKRKAVKEEDEDEEDSPSPKRVTRSRSRKKVVVKESSSEEEESESDSEEEKKPRRSRRLSRLSVKKEKVKKEDDVQDLLVKVEEDDGPVDEKPLFETSCYLLGLSDEIWCEILEYLNFDEYFNIAQVSKGMHFYSNLKVVWKNFICRYICPNAQQVQTTHFPQLEDNYKELFMKLYNNCCIVCGEYLRGDIKLDNPVSLAQSKGEIRLAAHPAYYNFLVDNCVCTSCQSNSLVETISKTELKRFYNVSDTELSDMRCMKSPNPFHRSTPMFKYLISQAKVVHQKKQEKALLLLHSKFKKLKISKGAYFALIQRGKRGHFGNDCLVYLALTGDKSNYKQKKLEEYIRNLILTNQD
ncbi:F-box domain-containing protein [Naegleria gruberi]|uniref:F-box domain-containing protein n=1 Tax=Naegleria gruberi TaxID=5762 RepID=D2VCH7_NAEGR|nr:F-box domain-containing protein [Naegleria gruberi]EFC45313.1 F-box domain-containing protein [Naegleria gruberi]|eukprot:XP_002678057.1 F-box domain-containing protein [Naegleria gruberi strain NEG-M]